MRIAIIGAGLAGLTAAAALRAAGLSPVVLEKSRGIGGRLATRRVATEAGAALAFDHGAPWVPPRPMGFAAFLREAAGRGEASEIGEGYVGAPGMSDLLRGLAAGLDIRFRTEVSALRRAGSGWRVETGEAADGFDRVICTAPAPQTARLSTEARRVAEAAAAAIMAPVWTVMAAWEAPGAARETATPAPPLGSIAAMPGRPGRPDSPFAVAAHATEEWSAAHLEMERPEAAAALVGPLAETLGLDPGAAIHLAAHRWRFARARRPVGAPFLQEDGLFVAGDWLLGEEAGDAWASGAAAAQALIQEAGRASASERN